jgi:6-pyruvoyltetrahydropterin/6-carboxytetrahydropterin synthase
MGGEIVFELTIITHFEAAHCLPNYPGKCARLHGHNWTVEVSIGSNRLDELGMVMDFKELKQEVHEVTELLDHRYLNEIEIWQNVAPTAENIAQYIYKELMKKIPQKVEGIQVLYVKVWESPGSAALYREVLA